MTLTALQKRCDQDDLAVNTEMVLTPLAAMQYGDSLSTRSLRWSRSQTQRRRTPPIRSCRLE
jgi:hypothetical protein